MNFRVIRTSGVRLHEFVHRPGSRLEHSLPVFADRVLRVEFLKIKPTTENHIMHLKVGTDFAAPSQHRFATDKERV